MIDNKVKEKPFVVYTPDSPLRQPFKLLRSMIFDLVTSYQLARRLTIRDISAQYRQTLLGYFWAILPPLVTSIIFIILNQANIISIGYIKIPYAVFVITGTIFWQLFVDSLNAPLKVLTINRSLLSKINFPKEALILSAIGQTLFSFFVKLILLAAVLLLYQIPIKITSLITIIPASGLLLTGLLFGLILAPIGVLYLDVQQGLVIFTSALMFFTPVLFPPPSEGTLGMIIRFNPLSPLFLSIRELIFNGNFKNFDTAAFILCIALILLLLSWMLYRIALPIIIERMDS